jgi:hypothetical protein
MNSSERLLVASQLLLLLKITAQNDERLTCIPIDLLKEDFLEMMIELKLINRVIVNGVNYYQYIKPSETEFFITSKKTVTLL